MVKINAFGMSVLVSIFLLVEAISGGEFQEKEILEKLNVTNVGITVRVFHKRKPVKDLQIRDFRLQVNGKVTPISYFEEHVQTISPEKSRNVAQEFGTDQRVFVFIFNISDHRIELEKALDILFDRIVQPGDRYILISNSFTLNDRLIQEPLQEKEKIKHILAVESAKARARISGMQMAIRTIYQDYISLKSEKEAADLARENFITNYIDFIHGLKTQFMRLDEEQFLQLAGYLKGQEGEKYVINFFQMCYIPKVKAFSTLDDHLRGSIRYLEVMEAMSTPDEIEEKSLAELFLDSGASFHTILMGSANRVILDESFKYAALTLNSESILKRITKAMGGVMIRSNDLGLFFKDVFTREDVFYTIFYKLENTVFPGENSLTVTLPNHRFKTVYNNGSRNKYFQSLVRQHRNSTPQITVDELTAKAGTLHFVVKDFKMEDSNVEDQGNLMIRITAFDEQKGLFVSDRKLQTFTTLTKLNVNVFLNMLAPGNYKILVEVTDINTRKNDLGMTRFHVEPVD